MQREIKFRGWDVNQKKMSILRAWDFAHGSVELGKELQPKADKFEEEVEIMQYTNLKDSKGVEIYEADIVKLEGEVVKVKFDIEGWYPFVALRQTLYSSRDFEVIGNVFENPELLEGKE